MKENLTLALSKLSKTYYQAKGTDSYYFKIGCIKVRISDHLSFNTDADLAIFGSKRDSHYTYAIIPMIGTFKEVQWFYNTKDAIDFIITYERMARLMIKLPPNYEPKPEESSKDDKYSDVPLTGKIDHNVWKKHLQFIYLNKDETNAVLADKVWSLDGTRTSFGQLRKMGHLTVEARKNQLEKLILSLQNETI